MIRFFNTTSVPVIRGHWLRGVYQPKRRSSRWRLARRVSNRLESDIRLLPAHFSQPISSNPFITQFVSPFHERVRFQARSPTPCHDFRQMPRTPAVGHREAALCAQRRLSICIFWVGPQGSQAKNHRFWRLPNLFKQTSVGLKKYEWCTGAYHDKCWF